MVRIEIHTGLKYLYVLKQQSCDWLLTLTPGIVTALTYNTAVPLLICKCHKLISGKLAVLRDFASGSNSHMMTT